ncbi:MAG: MFS transporter [Alphaproteobacteria bacterium]|nr:MFS transporter [Alphaproteobacteria bacterium]
MTDIAADARHDFKILGLICGGHFFSHFFMLAIPALMIFFHRDLGISYTLLGLALSIRYGATAVAQVAAGFLVDRHGAMPILLTGLFVMVTGMALLALADNFWMILILIVLAGIGDAVFHPADYAIINGSISEGRMGRAFSVHTFSGHLGFAAAPAFITVVATQWNWQTAVLSSAMVGYAVWLAILIFRAPLKDDVIRHKAGAQAADAPRDSMADHAKLLTSRPVLLLFAFFAMSSLGNAGIHNFSIPALNALHGTSEVDAGFAVGTYMLVSSFAVLAGGWISDNIHRQDRFAALCYVGAILAVLMVALLPLHYLLLVVALGFAGFCHGVIRPARDLMVREVVPKGSTGKVFGFVFTGQAAAGGIAPVILGFAMDNLPPQWIFFISIGFMVLCILTIIAPRGPMTRPAAAE